MKFDWKYWLLIGGLILLAYVVSFIIRKVLSVAIRRKSEQLNADPTKFVFIKNSVSFIIFTIVLIIIFLLTPELKLVGKGLFAGAGILAATIGFASQKAFSNILSGIFILIFKPFSVRDTIELRSEGMKGIVEELTLRHTVIRDYENRRIIIPNSLISETTLVNSSIVDQRIKKHIEFGISYDSNIDLAKRIIQEEIIKHPKFLDVRTNEETNNDAPILLIKLVNLSEYSVILRAYVWSESNDDAFVLQCDVYESIKKRFDKEGIEIPYPHRTIVYKKE
ncbi:MAG: mechanosensitive ion channel [Bacteroidales bacterium]|nr:mechanosensitive ion channel [Bacteroidales bacterium]